MPVKVVDASALGALIFGKPEAENVEKELSGDSLIAPSLIHYELASICQKETVNHPLKTSQLKPTITSFPRMPNHVISF